MDYKKFIVESASPAILAAGKNKVCKKGIITYSDSAAILAIGKKMKNKKISTESASAAILDIGKMSGKVNVLVHFCYKFNYILTFQNLCLAVK